MENGGRGKRKRNQNIRHRDLSLLGREDKKYIKERVEVRGVKGGRKCVYVVGEKVD